jgi:type IV pilus assembly protein PilE
MKKRMAIVFFNFVSVMLCYYIIMHLKTKSKSRGRETVGREKGFTLVELLVVVAIIGVLATIAVPMYIGSVKKSMRTEASSNLQTLRLLEEQFYAENARYTISLGTCAKDNSGNVLKIQQGGAVADPTNALPGFKPGNVLNYSYCLEQNIKFDGTAQTPCFRASAYGNTGSSVNNDIFRIDCNNTRNF